MADKTGDNLDIVVNIVAKADKQAAVQETTKVVEAVTKQFDTLSRKDIGKKLIRTFTSNGNVSKTLFNTLFRDLKTGQYFVQARKKGWSEVTDASGRKRRKERFYTFGKLRRISQEEAWSIGGIDPSVVYSQIEKAKQEEEAKRIAKEQARIAKEKQDAEKKAAEQARRKELSERKLVLAEKKQTLLEQKFQAELDKSLSARDETSKTTSKTLTKGQRFLNTFKRIGFYRIVRGIFAGIRNIFVQGIQGLAEFDKGANQTVSELLTGYERLKASMALVVMPILEAASPIITQITQSIADFANNISMANAASKGLTEYTAISDKYIKNMAKNSQKLLASFDKFDSLNAKDSPYETREITEENKKQIESGQKIISIVKRVFDIFKQLLDLIKTLSPILEPLLELAANILETIIPPLSNLIQALMPYAETFLKVIAFKFKILAEILAFVFDVLAKIFNFITQIGDYLKPLFEFLKPALDAVKDVLSIIYQLLKPIFDMLTGLKNIFTLRGTITSRSISEIKNQARTASFSSGSVSSLSTGISSGSAISYNSAQFRQEVFGALSDWWSTAQYDIPEQQATYIDTAEIARSKRFKSELNRTNPNLNLV